MTNYWERIEELRKENRSLRNDIDDLEALYRHTDLCDEETLSIIEGHIIELRNAIKHNCDCIETLRYEYKRNNERVDDYPIEFTIRNKIHNDGFIVVVDKF